MAFSFPSSPAVNDTYTVGSRTWTWTGSVWEMTSGLITSQQIADLGVTTAKLDDSAVTSAKIAAGAVVEADIGSGAVTEAKIGTGAVTAGKIGTGAVTETKIGANAVTQAKLASTLSAITICTSSTKPASPFDGQVIYMSDVDQTAVWDGSTWVVLSPIAGGRNLLINGDFKVWQRGNARTYMNAGSYLADRWCPILFQNAGHERVTGRATQYAMRVSSSSVAEASGGSRMWLVQKVESLNSYRLRSQQVTLSFWVRFSSATCSSSTATSFGNWTAGIGYYTTTTDSATGTTADDSATNLVLTNGSLPTTWTKYSVTGTCPSNVNNVHATFGFSGLGNTSSNSGVWYEIAEVQLEAGAVATPFEFEDYSTTLAKCQRYYYRVGGNVSEDFYISGYQPASTPIIQTYRHPVVMRTTPSIAQRVGTWTVINSSSQPTVLSASQDSYHVQVTVNAGISNANQSGARSASTSTYLEFGAEL